MESSLRQRVRASLREELLDAATDLLAEHGFRGFRMVDVAKAAGVSRQTVYNEFGDKTGLATAVAERASAHFLDGLADSLRVAPSVVSGLRSAALYTLRYGARDRLISAILVGDHAADLLPFLTTRVGPVVRPASEMVTRYLRENLPRLPTGHAALIADSLVRLTLSHLVLPSSGPEEAADAVAAMGAAALAPQLPV
ncbi:TetR family transcriptional regulator [Longimycelium tulufanense]|uniref:TetR family transcriptional regulator n=1 Tax=Longimycelium tulufanense TaxID=907463 RepID=A0A8J3CBI3_9PSEU|nr:TetR family transcriptional regulator [Longimycelium tulufanense]GGM43286.1 TetR family transcriptional regulator [Longimycelium tulufanense]